MRAVGGMVSMYGEVVQLLEVEYLASRSTQTKKLIGPTVTDREITRAALFERT